MGYVIAGIFVVAMVVLYLVLRRWDQDGRWEKEGHGSPHDATPGPKYRPLETPPSEPFD